MKDMKMPMKPRAHSGFTLVEVLVTVVILAIGLLGLAGLHASSLRSSSNAYLLTQATLLANDMGDRLRANRPGVAAGNYNALSVTASTNSTPTCLESGGCGSSAAVAAADAAEWGDALAAAALPSAAGTVTCTPVTMACTVTLRWDSDRSGALDAQDASNSLVVQL